MKHVLMIAMVASLGLSGIACGGDETAEIRISLAYEPAGEHCAQGGVAVVMGRDTNQNNQLDPAEIETVIHYDCNVACGEGMHDGGNETCVPVGTCAERYYDAGHDLCLELSIMDVADPDPLCFVGFTYSNGKCIPE